jgi:hypothetical protein
METSMTTRPAPAVTANLAPKKSAAKPKKSHKKKAAEVKVKVVRDSFTMPQNDYALIGELKQKALDGGLHIKKSELLRAGLRMLTNSSAAQFKKSVVGLEKIKTGRPKKD